MRLSNRRGASRLHEHTIRFVVLLMFGALVVWSTVYLTRDVDSIDDGVLAITAASQSAPLCFTSERLLGKSGGIRFDADAVSLEKRLADGQRALEQTSSRFWSLYEQHSKQRVQVLEREHVKVFEIANVPCAIERDSDDVSNRYADAGASNTFTSSYRLMRFSGSRGFESVACVTV